MQEIPITAAPFFQEYTFSALDPEAHAALIIERLLAYGNRAEVRWLFDTYGSERLRQWLAESGPQRLPRRRYNLWCVLLDITPETRKRQIWPY